MTDNSLDEIFKKQLPGYESPVPDDMWERIIRKKDKDRRGFFFFFRLIGLFLLGFGIAGILLFSINKKGIKKQEPLFNNGKAISNSDTVQSAGTDHDVKMNPIVSHDVTSAGADKVLKIEHTHDQKIKLSSERK